eukprot:TRINITY_DN9752_c0_g1_i1.p1 TRINITY_DN9752_c0_g1~~TRINITY_DN9752_c0_g1_i1.p1  ORF type:complete len:185 (+),score=19.24 TRINITY_DN9752_c0_g1_i1:118-672(+)
MDLSIDWRKLFQLQLQLKWELTGLTLTIEDDFTVRTRDSGTHASAISRPITTDGLYCIDFHSTEESSQTWFGFCTPRGAERLHSCYYTDDGGYAIGSNCWQWQNGQSRPGTTPAFGPSAHVQMVLDLNARQCRYYIDGQHVFAADTEVPAGPICIATAMRVGSVIVDWNAPLPQDYLQLLESRR